MATSGSFDWAQTKLDIIKESLETVNALPLGTAPAPYQIVTVGRTLENMIKSWQAEPGGNFLWKTEWRTQALTASSEVTGTDSNIYTCIKNHTGASANKPITGSYYTDFWKQTGSTGGVWATSAYKAIGNITFTDIEVLGIENAFWRSGSTDTPIDIITRENYFALSDKTTTGTPSKLYFEVMQTGLNNIYLWPQPDTSTDILHYAAMLRVEDFDGLTNNPDFDNRWYDALVWNLAARLAAGKYPISDSRRKDIFEIARTLRTSAFNVDVERDDLQIIPRSVE